jgi:signal transduction histidine kinase
MNKRLFLIYTLVFILTGMMLYLYRSSYKDMGVFIREVNLASTTLIRLQRLDALLHFWLNNDRNISTNMDLYMSPDVAYDSILATLANIKNASTFQEQRIRMDSIRREVREFQRMDEKKDTSLTYAAKEEFRKRVKNIVLNANRFSNNKLSRAKIRLEESTELLDRWLLWMLILAGTLITIATFYSFNFLSQRRKAEEFNKTLLDTTNNGIISFTPVVRDGIIEEYQITFCNEAGMKLLNLKSWYSRTLKDIVPKAVFSDLRQAFDDVYKTGTGKRLEGYLQIKNERKWLQADITPLDEGLLVSIYNLTLEKIYQQRLTYKINQLEIVNDELQQYAYVTSHDLQEPLRKIQMFSDIGLNLKGDEHARSKDDLFRKIQSIAGHMRELIQTLLSFTRSTDKPELLQDVNLDELVNEVINTLELRENQIKVILPHLPTVEGSAVHLKLLFTNLLSNSLKYAKPDFPLEITIKERKANQHDYQKYPALDKLVKYTCISIHDNGVGFKPHLNEKVFTIFQRLHNKENTPGTGIGLAICRKIVHQHQGLMFAKGRENQGASFYIFIPLKQPAESS